MRSRVLGLGLCAIVLAAAACATERPTRSYVQPNYLSKDMFKSGEWYYRQTVADVPPTHSMLFAGYTFSMEKVRWEIQEKWLVAYRSYELVPGSVANADPANKGVDATRYDPAQAEGRNPGFKEAPIAAYPIEKHFDIFRQYNSTTGEEINVLEENDRDRPWYDRKYFRIDWSQNQVVNLSDWSKAFSDFYTAAWWVQESEKTRESFRVDYPRDAQGAVVAGSAPNYFDFISRLFVNPSDYGCYFAAYDGTDCTASELKIRSSFLKVDGPRDFEPVFYDDRKMSKFGYFRTERLSYNRNRGITQSGRIYLANVHNIWKAAFARDAQGNIQYQDDATPPRQVFYAEKEGFHYRDAAGKPVVDAAGKIVAPSAIKTVYMPIEKRDPKPIVYHLSPNYPKEMIGVTERVTDSWNKAFRNSVAVAQNRELSTGAFNAAASCERRFGAGACADLGGGKFWKAGTQPEAIPDMYVLNYNGWVKTVNGQTRTDYRQLRDAPLAGAAATWTHDAKHEVFQLGDLRFNTIAWIHAPQLAGPLGYGPSSADPETGEIISGTAHQYGAAVDTYASMALDTIKLLNGNVNLDDFRTGRSVADYINRVRDRLDPRNRIPADVQGLSPSLAARAVLGERKLAKLEVLRRNGLPEGRRGTSDTFMQRVREAGLDNYLINDEIRIQMGRGRVQPGSVMTAEEKQRIALDAWATPGAMLKRTQARQKWALRQNITLAEFADDSVMGLAMEFRNRPESELVDGGKVWQDLRERIYQGLAEHEVGHTLGLRHNFQGSYDSLNYHDEFWTLRKENIQHKSELGNLSDLLQMSSRTESQIAGKISEYQYSTVMDYGARFNSDIHGIGRYDMAAIAFAYADSVEVFDFDRGGLDSDAITVMDFVANKPSPIYDNLYDYFHYTQIPYRLAGNRADALDTGVNNIKARKWVKWSELQAARTAAGENTENLPLEVPYLFCSDEWVFSSGSCQLWDQGADPYEINSDIIQRYNQYYYFNNYKRDRHGFDAFAVMQRVFQRYFLYLPNLYQNWLFNEVFSKDLYDVRRDEIGDSLWTIATVDGLNQLGETLTKPSYGAHQLVTTSDGPMYQTVSYSMSNGADGLVDIPRGEGRRLYSAYDFQSGYYLFDRTLEAGHFWDWLAALFSVVTTEATVLGVETASDFTTYVIPYYIVFEDELTQLMNGIYAIDYNAIGPRLTDAGVLKSVPTASYSGSIQLPTGTPVDTNINFTQQIYAGLYSMGFFTSNYSMHYPDQAHIFRIDATEPVTPGAGWEVESFTDPDSGIQYGCLKKSSGTTNTLAYKLVSKAKSLVPQVTSGSQNARYEFDSLMNTIWILRDMYKAFGRVF